MWCDPVINTKFVAKSGKGMREMPQMEEWLVMLLLCRLSFTEIKKARISRAVEKKMLTCFSCHGALFALSFLNKVEK
jgi:hypothetical protein